MLRRLKANIHFKLEDIYILYENFKFMLTLICAKAQNESEYSPAVEAKNSTLQAALLIFFGDVKHGIQNLFFPNPAKVCRYRETL